MKKLFDEKSDIEKKESDSPDILNAEEPKESDSQDILNAEKPKKSRKKRSDAGTGRGRGRTTKEDKLIMRYKTMEGTLQILSSAVAVGLNDPVWVIQDKQELESGGKAWVDALDHYFPGWEKASPGLALLIWAGGYAMQRVPHSKFFQKKPLDGEKKRTVYQPSM